MEIGDKVVIVTGASSGIGRATSKYLAGQGGHVVLAARSPGSLEELERELPGSLAVTTDVCRDRDVGNLVGRTLREFGRVDILINVAGQGMWTPVEEINIPQYRELMELNVYAPLRTMQAVTPVMRKQGGGLIVNVSSMTTKHYLPNLAGYASTKCALNALSLIARQELAADHIIVGVVLPKLVETDFGKHALVPEPESLRDRRNPSAPPMDTPEQVAEKIGDLIRSEEAELTL